MLLLLHLFGIIQLVRSEILGRERPCGVQYEPNNILTEILEYVNFYTDPLYYNETSTITAYGFSALSPFLDAVVDNNTISATTDMPGVLISNELFTVPANGAVQVRASFNYEAYLLSGAVSAPLGFQQDPFYAAAVFGLRSAGPDLWEFQFIVTNTKIYALYSYTDAASVNYFRYLIPVANRVPEETLNYSVTLSSDFSVSYRINDREVLRINSPNNPVDSRFNIGLLNPALRTINFILPAAVRLVLGLFSLQPTVSATRTACQRALFAQCSQTLQNAFGSNCQYTPLSTYSSQTAVFGMMSTYQEISAVRYTFVNGCPIDGNCPKEPVRCPRVRAARNHDGYRPTIHHQQQPIAPQCGCNN